MLFSGFPAQARLRAQSLFLVVVLLVAGRAAADFTPPAGWTRGAALTTYEQWDVFTSVDGNPPNLPDVGLFNPNAPSGAGLNVYDTSGTGLITSDNNIYSFSAPTDIHATIPNYGLGANYTTVVLAQTRTIGSEIDYAQANIGGTAPAASTELFRAPFAGPFGDTFTVDHSFTWVLPGSGASYSLEFPASDTSMSFDRLAVDTLTELTGDTNRDNVVNGLDISQVASHWLSSGAIGSLAGDANFDGVVNGLDIALIASHWLASPTSGASAAAVPEPSGMLLALAAIGIAIGTHLVRRAKS